MRIFNLIISTSLSFLLLLLGSGIVAGVFNQISYSMANALLRRGGIVLQSPQMFLKELYAWFEADPLAAGGIGIGIASVGFVWFLLEIGQLIPKTPKENSSLMIMPDMGREILIPKSPKANSTLILKSDADGEIEIPAEVAEEFIQQAVLQVANVESFQPRLERSEQGLIVHGVAEVNKSIGQSIKDLGEQIQTSIRNVVEQQIGISASEVHIQIQTVSKQKEREGLTLLPDV
jgi:uncharacterized alkaline shock family protein YloU